MDAGLVTAKTLKASAATVKKAEEAVIAAENQCLMDLTNQNTPHSDIILRAFGLAKDKMRSSQDEFDMSYHLFKAYTHVISNSEFCTA
ncbi:hypothetical protein CDAR_380031 [Caerostris darwini]|uniref:Uncharacterized protein n=2 Tax=Caerostris darwini TaxID=1538125 RepID=A0AAV4WFA2_9ARAC|nr:hypothetical protein CDAR_380031 [Caerostris darwini]